MGHPTADDEPNSFIPDNLSKALRDASDHELAGAERIAEERRRQQQIEGYSASHDDEHDSGELIEAAITYARLGRLSQFRQGSAYSPAIDGCRWPWHLEYWKPSDDPIRNLEKAGALIAAEIDRLQRIRYEQTQ